MVKWNDNLWLFTPEEFDKLPDRIILTCINGESYTKGIDTIDMDTRAGHIAYGIKDPLTHPEAELFSVFLLS